MSKFAESLNRSSLGSQLYRLQTRPQLLAQSQQVERLYELLTDFGFIAAKALHPEIKLQELIEDYDRVFEPSVLIAGEKAETLKLIQAALLQSAHILNKDKTQLVEQLWGRLHSFDIPEIQAMLSQAKQSKTCWLRLLTSSLTRADGRLLRTLIGHNDSVNAVAVTSDGKQIISGSSDNTLKVWNLKTGEEIFTLEGHTQAVTAVVVTPDGKGVISASEDKTIKIWDLQLGKEIFTLEGHQGSVNAIVVTSDGKRLFSGSSDKTIKEWNLETGEEISTINDRSIEGVTITHDDRWVIFCAYYPYIHGGQHEQYHSTPHWDLIIYDLKTKKKKKLSSTGGNSVNTFAITQDDKWVVFGSYGATLEIFNLENFKRKYFKSSGKLTNKKDFFTLNEHNNWVKAVTLTPDSKRIVSASADKTLKVWDREKSKELFTLEGHAGSVNSVAVTPNGKWAISASKDKTLKVWSIASEEEEKFTFISDIQLLDNENISKNDCNLENILKWENSKKILPFINQTDSVDAIEVTPDGRRVVSTSLGKTITVFNLETHEVISIHNQEDKEENFAFHTIAITPDSKYLISDTGKAMLSLWNLETGKFLFYLPSIFSVVIILFIIFIWLFWRFREFLSIILNINLSWLEFYYYFTFLVAVACFWFTQFKSRNVAISTDGKQVVSCLYKNIEVWNLKTRKKLFTLKGHSGRVTSLSIISEDKCLISGAIDKTLKVWNLKTGKELFTLKGHSDWITSVAVTPDGKQVISASKDKTIKVWDLEKRLELFSLKGHKNYVDKVTITPDGKRLISGSWRDNIIKLWDLESKQVIASFSGDSDLRCYAVAPDGVTIVAGEESGKVHFLRLEEVREA